MIVHSTDIHPLQQSSAYAMVYTDGITAQRDPGIQLASIAPVPVAGPAKVGATGIEGIAPCSIRRVYGGDAGVIAQCDGRPVSVAWTASEDLTPDLPVTGNTHAVHEQARRVLLRFMQPDQQMVGGQPLIVACLLLSLGLLLFSLYPLRARAGKD